MRVFFAVACILLMGTGIWLISPGDDWPRRHRSEWQCTKSHTAETTVIIMVRPLIVKPQTVEVCDTWVRSPLKEKP